jgi:hypothetical protein
MLPNAIVNAYTSGNFVKVAKVLLFARQMCDDTIEHPYTLIISDLSVSEAGDAYIITISGGIYNRVRGITMCNFVSDVEFHPIINDMAVVTTPANAPGADEPQWVHDQFSSFVGIANNAIYFAMVE